MNLINRNIAIFGLLFLISITNIVYERLSSNEWNYLYLASMFLFLFVFLEHAVEYGHLPDNFWSFAFLIGVIFLILPSLLFAYKRNQFPR